MDSPAQQTATLDSAPGQRREEPPTGGGRLVAVSLVDDYRAEQPQIVEVRRVALDKLAETLNGVHGLFTLSEFHGGIRKAKRIKEIHGLVVDVDRGRARQAEGRGGDIVWEREKSDVPAAEHAQWQATWNDGCLPGTAFYVTPHGLRVIFVLDHPLADIATGKRVIKGARFLVAESLRRLGLSASAEGGVKGSELQPEWWAEPCSDGLAQPFWGPRATRDGRTRQAAALVRGRLYTVAELLAHAPPARAKEARRSTNVGERPRRVVATTIDDARASFNRDRRVEFGALLEACDAKCPECGESTDGKSNLRLMEDGGTLRGSCWSARHHALGHVREDGSGGYFDALDYYAWTAGMSPVALLQERGYLRSRSGSARTAARSREGEDDTRGGASEEDEYVFPSDYAFPGTRDTDRYGDLRRLLYFRKDLLFVEGIGWAIFEQGRWCVEADTAARVHVIARRVLMDTAQILLDDAESALAALEAGTPTGARNQTAEESGEDRVATVKSAKRRMRACEQALARARDPSGASSLVKDLRNHLAVSARKMDDPDQTAGWLVVSNGLLDLRSARLYPWRQDLYLTRSSPIAWDPTAECPTWRKFMRDFTNGDEELEHYIEAWAHLAILGDGKSSTSLWFLGPGGGGRNTLFEALEAVFGTYAHKGSWSLVKKGRGASGHTEDLARCRGARFVYISETGDDLDGERFKEFTGDRELAASHKGEKGFTMRRTWLLAMAGQGLIGSLRDSGVRRRAAVIQTEQSFSERDADVVAGHAKEADLDLGEKLRTEAPGILRSIVEARRYLREGGRLPRCAAVDRATESHVESDPDRLRDFLFEALEPRSTTEKKRPWVAKDALFQAYRGHLLEATGESQKSLRDSTFFRRLNSLIVTDVEVRRDLLGLGEGTTGLPERKQRAQDAPAGSPRVRVINGVRLTERGARWLETWRDHVSARSGRQPW